MRNRSQHQQPSFSRLIYFGIGWLLLFLVLVTVFYVHRESQLEEQKVLRHQISELKALLDNHAVSQRVQEKAIKDQFESSINNVLEQRLPVLEGAISKMMKSANSYDNHLNGSVMNLRNTYNDVMTKIMGIEKMINILDKNDQSHNYIHKTFVEPHLRGVNATPVVDNASIVSAVLKILNTKTDNSVTKQKDNDINSSFDNINSLKSNGNNKSSLGADTVLLIIASNRPEYLKRSLNYILKYYPRGSEMPIFISEDGSDSVVKETIDGARAEFKAISPNSKFMHKNFPQHEDAFENGYFQLSSHFKWALDQVFFQHVMGSSAQMIRRVIILEEDLQIAPDFFEYFAAVAPLLDSDNQLLAASAWNDNGQNRFIKDNRQLYRSDFFPGLGWMMNRQIWEEFSPKWPKAYWDDWIREPPQRKGRHFIRPEVCRTFHFGRMGMSRTEFEEYLNDIYLNEEFVAFTDMDLSYLKLEEWDKAFSRSVETAKTVTRDSFPSAEKASEVKIVYSALQGNKNSFVSIATWAGIMTNIKANVPRGAYKGVVTVWKDGIKLHITPSTFT